MLGNCSYLGPMDITVGIVVGQESVEAAEEVLRCLGVRDRHIHRQVSVDGVLERGGAKVVRALFALRHAERGEKRHALHVCSDALKRAAHRLAIVVVLDGVVVFFFFFFFAAKR